MLLAMSCSFQSGIALSAKIVCLKIIPALIAPIKAPMPIKSATETMNKTITIAAMKREVLDFSSSSKKSKAIEIKPNLKTKRKTIKPIIEASKKTGEELTKEALKKYKTTAVSNNSKTSVITPTLTSISPKLDLSKLSSSSKSIEMDCAPALKAIPTIALESKSILRKAKANHEPRIKGTKALKPETLKDLLKVFEKPLKLKCKPM